MTLAARFAGALAAILAAAAPASAADLPTRAAARASIVEAMALRMQWATAMPSVRGDANGASFMGIMPSMAMGMMMPATARLIMRREDQTGEPVTAPAAFEIVSTRGTEAVVVRTGLTADVRLTGGAFASGSLPGRAAASIDVARGLILTSTGGPAVGGPTTLVVMVQYN